jgi:hypothetical protein
VSTPADTVMIVGGHPAPDVIATQRRQARRLTRRAAQPAERAALDKPARAATQHIVAMPHT